MRMMTTTVPERKPQTREQGTVDRDGHFTSSCPQSMHSPVTVMSEISSPKPTILVTGGCGYIGSHTIVCLLEQGYNVVVVDNLLNSSPASLDRVAKICGLSDEDRKERLVFFEADLCDKEALRNVFEASPVFQSCIHFAGLKVRSPLLRPRVMRSVSDTSLSPYILDCDPTRLSEKVPRFH